MTRRSSLFALFPWGIKKHECSFALSAFYLTAAIGFEEPEYYPPSALIRMEACSCGALRLPEEVRSGVGRAKL